nr:60S ribosomal protein L23a-like [Pongo abelii]
MAMKTKKEAPVPPKAKAKAKPLRAKKAVLKSDHRHSLPPSSSPLPPPPASPQMYMSPTWQPKTLQLWRQPKYLERAPTGERNKRDHYAIIKSLLTTGSAMKKIEDDNTLVDVKVNKYQIKHVVKKLYDTDVVNTLIRPEGEKKADV